MVERCGSHVQHLAMDRQLFHNIPEQEYYQSLGGTLYISMFMDYVLI